VTSQSPVLAVAPATARGRVEAGARRSAAVVIVAHGLIHLLGAAKGLGWAQVDQLEEPVSVVGGVAWFVVGVAVVLAGVMLATRHRRFVPAGVIAAIGSQAMILTAWTDARAGTTANVLLLAAAIVTRTARTP
jgi:hypothetical protein